MTSQSKHRAIICIAPKDKATLSPSCGRKMHSIIRRYTPDVIDSGKNIFLVELTGLRTFFKMTYTEMADAICKDLAMETAVRCGVRIASASEFDKALSLSKKASQNISTYKEINSLFAGRSFVAASNRKITRTSTVTKKVKLTVPFLGKVS